MRYEITSSKVAGRELGDKVTDDDLEGLNVAALLRGHHIKPAAAPAKKKAATKRKAAD